MGTTGASLARGQSKQTYATPPEFMRAVVDRFDLLSFDLAASADNAKNPNYFTEEQNSLVQKWHEIRGILWLNPPFSNIEPWAEKCAAEAKLGAKILFLTPASVGANWFMNHVHRKALVLGLNGRITFVGCKDAYPKDCVLSCYGWKPDFDCWTWPQQISREQDFF